MHHLLTTQIYLLYWLTGELGSPGPDGICDVLFFLWRRELEELEAVQLLKFNELNREESIRLQAPQKPTQDVPNPKVVQLFRI